MHASSYKQRGDTVKVTAPSGGMTVGLPYLISFFFGFAVNTAAEGDSNELEIVGVHNGPKASPAIAFANGAKVYWDDAAKNFTSTAGGNTYVGTAVGGWAGTTTSMDVRLNGSLP